MITHSDRITNNRVVEGTQTRAMTLFGLSRRQVIAAVGLGLIVLLGVSLRFYQLGAYSIGNAYYAATVQSMLTSWHNFFFAAFEPGGSVTVDKPPLGFWVQAASAYLFGVNGFALALPQALAGVLSIPLLYTLVKRQFGREAGLIAALALAIMPVAVSTERNNMIDGLLVLVLLLATWAVLQAVYNGRLRYLLLGAFLVGLGFNIKMLQAFLPLPALYALYLLGAPHRWWKRVVHLIVATVVLAVVSLSWAIVVDLTPAESRPYIGSSTNNTVMELIVGHNGLKRLGLDSLIASTGSGSAGDKGSRSLPHNAGQPGQSLPGQSPPNPLPPLSSSGQPGQFLPGQDPPPPPPNGGQPGQFLPPPPPNAGQPGQSPPGQPPGRSGAGSGPGNRPPLGQGNPPGNPPGQPPGGPSQEVGQPGWSRLFTKPLVAEAGWLLPLGLLGIPLVLAVLGWQWPLSDKHLALVLWGGWLLPELAYFTFTSGLFHAYYLIMLGPPLAALVGATAWALWKVCQKHRWLGWILSASFAGGTLAFQVLTLRSYPALAVGVAAVSAALLLLGLGLLALIARQPRAWAGKAALGMALAATMIAPLVWSGLTTLNTNPDVALPRSGPGTGRLTKMSTVLSPAQEAILDYLLANTDPDDYLVASLSSHGASPYILATQRPVLTFGGFNGRDDVISVDQLAQMVVGGELRFVLDEGLAREKPEIAAWISEHCTTVTIPGATRSKLASSQTPGPGRPGQDNSLYDCGSH